VIFDVVSYSRGLSSGANRVTVGTVVCHHVERESDVVRWLRDEISNARHGTPAPPRDAGTLMESLAYVALQPYMALAVDAAVTAFMQDWRETSYIHELGHIFSTQANLTLTVQSGEEEALAYLTELRYGGMPHYTLRNMVSMETMPGLRQHGEGAGIVFAEFARHIRDAKARGDGFETIEVGMPSELPANDDVDRIAYQLWRLRAEEICALADRVFEERYRPRVKG
jgi:hypothetical protein